MKIGAVVGDFLPDAGGGYTFVTDVFRSLIDSARESAHKFVGLCGPSSASKWSAATQNSEVAIATVNSESLLVRTIREIFVPFPSIARRLSPLHPIDRVANEHKVDMVWHVGGGGGVATDTPYIATVWDLQHRTHPYFPEVSAAGLWQDRERLYQTFLQRAARIVCGTRCGAQEISSYYGIPDERIFLIPHPTPSAYLEEARDTSAQDAFVKGKFDLSGKFFVYPANFWAHKNHVNLLHGFKFAQTRYPGIVLVLTGDNKGNREFVMQTARELGLSASVRFPGLVSAYELKSLYRHAVALTYASFSGPENLPPLEAFATGCPVLNSDFPGAREQLGDAALFFDPRDPSSIGSAMLGILSNDALRKKLIDTGHNRATRMTSTKFVQSIFSLLDKLAPERACWR